MKEFICEYCGKRAINMRKCGKEQRFCSAECRKKADNLKHGYGDVSCLYNKGVICSVHKCENCGWHPEVEQKRKESLEHDK